MSLLRIAASRVRKTDHYCTAPGRDVYQFPIRRIDEHGDGRLTIHYGPHRAGPHITCNPTDRLLIDREER